MNVLLVRPPVPKHTIGLKHIMICEPLELEYVAANLEQHSVKIFDMLLEKGFAQVLREFEPDVVVSSCYKTGTNEVIKLFRKTKAWRRDCITIAGGVHATLVPEDFADPATDCVGIGDGTFLLAEIVDALAAGESLYEIPGIAIPTEEGKVEQTGIRPYMPSADSLPLPRRDLVSHLADRYYYLMHKPLVTMKTTWGCWYKCNFCFTWKITGGTPYVRSAESIADELETIQAKEVYIVDDIFLIKKTRLAKLAKLLRERNIEKHYLVYARADFIAENEEVIAEWSELGLRAVFIGLEASTDSELEGMNKECSVDANREAIRMLQKYQIDCYGSLIPGADYLPEDWNRLWKFIKETGLYYVNISPHTPLPGAEIWPDYQDQLTVPVDAHGLFDLSHMLMPTRMSLKGYYRQLLLLYIRTIWNLRRASSVTQKTLPSIFSWQYFRVLVGTTKIGRQFFQAHRHHTPKEIAIARYKGEEVPGLTFEEKFRHPSFQRPQLQHA